MKPKKPSPGYHQMLDYINSTPEVLSSLYDLNLMPEQVSDRKRVTSKMCMMAFVWGYQLAKGELPKAKP